MISKKVIYWAAAAGGLAIVLWLHHWALHGYPWLDRSDIQNHEFFIGIFGMLGLGLLIGGGLKSA